MLEMTGATIWATWAWYRTQTVTFWKKQRIFLIFSLDIWVFGSTYRYLGKNSGIWVKIFVFGVKTLSQNIVLWIKYGSLGQVRLVWQIWPSGQELGSQPQAPGSIPPAPLVGSNLCASRRRTLRGLFFAKKSVLKLGIVDFLDFNKNVKSW